MNYFALPAWGNSAPQLNFGPSPVIPAQMDYSQLLQPQANSPVPAANSQLEFGMNIPTFQLGLQGLGTIGNLWGTLQSTKLAKDNFKFQKMMGERNLANQIKSYNTALTDRATTRGFVQGDSKDSTQSYINTNKL